MSLMCVILLELMFLFTTPVIEVIAYSSLQLRVPSDVDMLPELKDILSGQ